MSHYLLSVYSVDGAVEGSPTTPDEMREFLQNVATLEEEMDRNGAFVFGGALFGPGDARVVSRPTDKPIVTDGPFVEAKEHIGGFYIIEAADLDEALAWAGRVAEATRHSIEVRPFRQTGRVEVPTG